MNSIEEIKKVAQGKSILLVEDNEINAMITQMQLKSVGFDVQWVSDGAQAMSAYLASENKHFSCVVTDLMMPVLDGIETARRIRKSERGDANIPIIAVTANAYVNQAMTGHDSSIDKFLVKPYDKMELLDWVCDKVREFEDTNGTTINKAQ